ncbi:MAG: hypothetical protein GF353_07935 [Candidatus Lokiarchaeota archaeon]|nr:hypothetical protein [Candidatus Lokiarchaeota archaeon]
MLKPKNPQLSILIMIFIICSFLQIASFSTERVAPDDVQQAAESGFKHFLDAIPANDLDHFGFAKGVDFNKVTLGRPFKVYQIVPELIQNHDSHAIMSSLLSPTKLWYFPLIYEREYRTLLTVDYIKNEWKAVALGSSGIASELNLVEQKFGSEYLFVRIFQAASDFLIFSIDGIQKIMPLESTKISLKLDSFSDNKYKLYNPNYLIPKFIQAINLNE